MRRLYTSGDWYVKDGHEQAFVDAWSELAEWTIENVPGCTFAKLLRDEQDATHFVSFSPWRDEGAVEAWRAHPGFQERVGRLQQLLASFEARTLDVAAEVGPSTPDPWPEGGHGPGG